MAMQTVKQKGMTQTVHVLIATYTEPAVTVRECVLRLLVAPEPIYMEKMIYVCDDGHAKSEGPKKKAMVEELRILGVLLQVHDMSCPCSRFSGHADIDDRSNGEHALLGVQLRLFLPES